MGIKLGLNCRETQHVKAAVLKSFVHRYFGMGSPLTTIFCVINGWLNHRFDCFFVWSVVVFNKACSVVPIFQEAVRNKAKFAKGNQVHQGCWCDVCGDLEEGSAAKSGYPIGPATAYR